MFLLKLLSRIRCLIIFSSLEEFTSTKSGGPKFIMYLFDLGRVVIMLPPMFSAGESKQLTTNE